jgi:hypothetical protein
MKVQKKQKQFLLIFLFTIIVIVAIIFYLKSNRNIDLNLSPVDLEIERFDKALFSDFNSPELHAHKMDSMYPEFFALFTEEIISIGKIGDKSFNFVFETFLMDYAVEQGKIAVKKEFESMEDIEKTLGIGFAHLLHYYPETELPKIYTFIAGFNHSVVTADKLIAIGLDKYLGRDCELYEMMQIPNYARQNMHREMIPVDCMRAWAMMEFPEKGNAEFLVYKMIQEGKMLFLLDALFPEMTDALKIGFTQEQIDYCTHFEANMWQHLVSEDLLFSTDNLQHRKFLGDAPFTAAFGNESPGRTGAWLGWQVVKSYMKESGADLNELMQEQDYQKILNQSYYNPK